MPVKARAAVLTRLQGQCAPCGLGPDTEVDQPAPGLEPVDPWWDDTFVAGIPTRHYLQYLGRSSPGAWTFRIPQGHRGDRLRPGQRYAVDIIDTWDMTVTPVDRVFELADVRRNDATATDPSPIALPSGRPLVLRIRRLD